ncbi:MAG: helix-turn-helix domain-containing protein [Oscillospiraceae bacterium]|nr:helix-turn-helix domain-containing protein [Oscillospiraceae bacterium]
MKSDQFNYILKSAVAGSHEALEIILKMYEPLIHKHSMVNGKLDEDLRQYIMIHIALNISKFPL